MVFVAFVLLSFVINRWWTKKLCVPFDWIIPCIYSKHKDTTIDKPIISCHYRSSLKCYFWCTHNHSFALVPFFLSFFHLHRRSIRFIGESSNRKNRKKIRSRLLWFKLVSLVLSNIFWVLFDFSTLRNIELNIYAQLYDRWYYEFQFYGFFFSSNSISQKKKKTEKISQSTKTHNESHMNADAFELHSILNCSWVICILFSLIRISFKSSKRN